MCVSLMKQLVRMDCVLESQSVLWKFITIVLAMPLTLACHYFAYELSGLALTVFVLLVELKKQWALG